MFFLLQVLLQLWFKVSFFLTTQLLLKLSHVVRMSLLLLLLLPVSPLYSLISLLVTICGAAGGVSSRRHRAGSHYTSEEDASSLRTPKGTNWARTSRKCPLKIKLTLHSRSWFWKHFGLNKAVCSISNSAPALCVDYFYCQCVLSISLFLSHTHTCSKHYFRSNKIKLLFYYFEIPKPKQNSKNPTQSPQAKSFPCQRLRSPKMSNPLPEDLRYQRLCCFKPHME